MRERSAPKYIFSPFVVDRRGLQGLLFVCERKPTLILPIHPFNSGLATVYLPFPGHVKYLLRVYFSPFEVDLKDLKSVNLSCLRIRKMHFDLAPSQISVPAPPLPLLLDVVLNCCVQKRSTLSDSPRA